MALRARLLPAFRLLYRAPRHSPAPVAKSSRRRRTPRQAMIACASGVAVYLILHAAMVGLFRAGTMLGDPVFDRRAAGLEKRLKKYATPDGKCIVLFGTSRMQCGMMGDVIEEELRDKAGVNAVVFNFSRPGTGPVAYHLQLRRLLERGIKPEHVVVEVFLPLLQRTPEGPLFESKVLASFRLRRNECELAERYGIDADVLHRDRKAVETNPWQNLREPIFERLDPRLLPDGAVLKYCRLFDRTGGNPVDFSEQWLPRIVECNAVADQHYRGMLSGSGIAPEARRALEEFVALCAEHRIGVTLVAMPENATFRGMYPAENRLAVRQLMDHLCRIAPAHVVDAESWLDDERYIDGHHLFRAGAERFTRRLCEDHLIPALTAGSGNTH